MNKEEFKLHIVSRLKNKDIGLRQQFIAQIDRDTNIPVLKEELELICSEFLLGLNFKQITLETGEKAFTVSFQDIECSEAKKLAWAEYDMSNPKCYKNVYFEYLDIVDLVIKMGVLSTEVIPDKNYSLRIKAQPMIGELNIDLRNPEKAKKKINKNILDWILCRNQTNLYHGIVISEDFMKKLEENLNKAELLDIHRNEIHSRLNLIYKSIPYINHKEDATVMMQLARFIHSNF